MTLGKQVESLRRTHEAVETLRRSGDLEAMEPWLRWAVEQLERQGRHALDEVAIQVADFNAAWKLLCERVPPLKASKEAGRR